MGPVLDAEMPEQVIWPDQVVCGGLAWTQTFSWQAEGQVLQTYLSPQVTGRWLVSFLVSFMFVYLSPSPSTAVL